MRVRVLNFDGALLQQPEVLEKYRPEVCNFFLYQALPTHQYGSRSLMPPKLGRTFEWDVALSITNGLRNISILHLVVKSMEMMKSLLVCKLLPRDQATLLTTISPVTFFGSNDFHHVSLALIRRLRQPINTVLFDVHPDYLFNPFGHHCGCWYNLVTSLPTVHQGFFPSFFLSFSLLITHTWTAFHFGGGSGEFEDPLLLEMTPWHHILSGKMRIFPTSRTLSHGEIFFTLKISFCL